MDFVEGMPKLEGFDTILVVVDQMTKFNHFLTLAHPFMATEVARKLMDSEFKIHGLPRAVVSDRDGINKPILESTIPRVTNQVAIVINLSLRDR